eukprot:TRINITY_DN8261_c0_g1_i1.p1 TRINITY_DN8261_c0_g1~~TRINITY_DN8261_c0_g1_i1.p1  ORF type:complete len:225 (-),score=23.34 TRINITY_DN8261_c0_g1_i1:295-969(-)
MARSRRCLFLFALVCFLETLCSVKSLRFDLQSGQTKCIADDIQNNILVLGNYHVVKPGSEDHHFGTGNVPPLDDSHKITVRVTSPYGNSVHFADLVERGHFSFTTSEAGDYMTCFWMPHAHPVVTSTIEFEWKSGVLAKDWTSIAKREKIDGLELELRKLEEYVTSIYDEMIYLRGREEQMQNLNASTEKRMTWFSLCSLIVCVSVAAFQFYHLKNFFERKKLL